MTKNCRASSCRKCNARHHTLLHYDRDDESKVMVTDGDSSGDTKHQISNDNSEEVSRSEQQETNCYSVQTEKVLLSTALVAVKDHQGISRNIRVLLDFGSQRTSCPNECVMN
ncbi:hypothetical protein JTB14_008188 [Gonioctena quinquepunctata]|nr:hypothetical protein JTB14_008188 [Gonioctena quinquepunctata]